MQTIVNVLPTRWQQKPAGVDKNIESRPSNCVWGIRAGPAWYIGLRLCLLVFRPAAAAAAAAVGDCVTACSIRHIITKP